MRKKVIEFYKRPQWLGVALHEDKDSKLNKHYYLETGIPKVIRGNVTLIVDVANRVYCLPDKNKTYEFEVKTKLGPYTSSGDYSVEYRRLMFPKELADDYAIDANMGVELVLNEITYKVAEVLQRGGADETEKIFANVEVKGAMDFEPKGISGEVLDSSELLVTKFDNEFYVNLAWEINNAFRVRLFTATMVLVRKLFENLLVDLIRDRYISDPSKISLFFNPKKHEYRSFVSLKDSLKDNLIDFEPYDPSIKKDKDFIRFLEEIKEKGDESAHTLEIFIDPNEINNLKASINKYSDLLVRLIQKVKETPK